ncbi:RNA polymerase sigma factor SigJ [Actinocatenispora rupis]|uniref:RNA polymerase sigma factor SigJ n=1 Tax=Actinocatenispora rupis TaxID=519421 RepID=A0A8J3NHS2_9ACTN|nr:RNA polymerase sigma factor SigJ [Actinocatenispora rupis]GID16334.1 RNA polymerase sigma factor SigJ [Actinocatenispora rupis]
MGEADEFEAERRHLLGVAYRMLGGWAEAEDAVQEAWLRWTAADRSTIESPRGWLTTVTGRICLDVLRSARVRRESYVGSWLPEPVVERLADPAVMDPGDRVATTDEVSVALLAVLEKQTPEQRVAFVLHDVFDVPFDQVASTLGVSVQSARQLASRARRAVRTDTPKHNAELAEQRTVLDAFLRACREGDLDGLLAVLAPDVTLTGDGGGVAPAVRVPVEGLVKVGRFLLNLGERANHDPDVLIEPVLVNGDLGLLVHGPDPSRGEDLTIVMAFAYAEGRITAVYNQLNPAKLTRAPRPDPDRAIWQDR